MSGIAISFDNMEEYLDLPIQYIQVMFRQGRKWTDPTNEQLFKMRNKLWQRNIRPIIHINFEIHITNLTNRNLSRAKQEIDYGRRLNARYIVIHCGTRGDKKQIPTQFFRERLNDLVNLSQI